MAGVKEMHPAAAGQSLEDLGVVVELAWLQRVVSALQQQHRRPPALNQLCAAVDPFLTE